MDEGAVAAVPFSRAPARRSLAIVASLALGSSLSLSAGATPIRLLGVSAHGNAVLIESTEPAAYVVKRPDPLTVVVELRNVSVASACEASSSSRRRDPIASVTLEQGAGDDGQTVARVRVGLSRPQEYAVRSARNTIRLELTAPTGVAADARSATADPSSARGASLSTPRSGGRGSRGDHPRSRALQVYARRRRRLRSVATAG